MARIFTSSLRSRWKHGIKSRRCEAQTHNATYSRLYNVPAEVLESIRQNLSCEDSIAMALTCARFYHSSSFASTRPGPNSSAEIHFKGLCLLEHDGGIKGYCCRGCSSKHSSGAFSYEELNKPASERYCLRTKPCFRVSADQVLGFADMQKALGLSKGNKVPRLRPLDSLVESYFRPKFYIDCRFPVYPASSQVFDLDFVAICCKLNCVFCPHLRMGDIRILELYPRWTRSSTGTDVSLNCKHCETKVSLGKYNLHGRDWVEFRVRRLIGKLFSPLELSWLTQTFASQDPLLDDTLDKNVEWFIDYWQRQPEDDYLETFPFPDPNADRAFTLPTLPNTVSSRAARLRTRARLIATLPAPKKIYDPCYFPGWEAKCQGKKFV